MLEGIRKQVVSSVVTYLTKPVSAPRLSEATDLRSLKTRLRVGDVILVSGNTRIARIIKLLTRSPWSHVVLYVGDRQELLEPSDRPWLSETYGSDARSHLVLDADPMRGVYLTPVDTYSGLMLRHCRPEALTPDDAERVALAALSQLGRHYDIRHILRLSLFFLVPWGVFPENIRRFVTEFTLSESDTICSRVVSEAFYTVGYPIRPLEVIENRQLKHQFAANYLAGLLHRGRTAAKLLFGGRVRAAVNRLTDRRYIEIREKGTRYIIPADYDLSRFFSVIKDPADLSITYRTTSAQTPERGITPRKPRWSTWRSRSRS